ncbi:MAG: hypothetical protein AAGA83_03705 [Cyanobacteria bacterium P01_F01_bin.116]
MSIYLSPKKILRWLCWTIASLVILCLVGMVFQYLIGDFYLEHSLQWLTNLDEKNSITNWYSTSALFLCSLLFLILACADYPVRHDYKNHWGVLAFCFLFFSLDKSAEIHHSIKHDLLYRLPKSFDVSEIFLILLSCCLLFVVGLLYKRFFYELPKQTQRLFLISGFVIVTGNFGIGTIGQQVFQGDGHVRSIGNLVLLTEELCEMMGITILIYALISHIGLYTDQINVRFRYGLTRRPAESGKYWR